MSRARTSTTTARCSGVSVSQIAGGGAGMPRSRTNCSTHHLRRRIGAIIEVWRGADAAQQAVDDGPGTKEIGGRAERASERERRHARSARDGAAEWSIGRPVRADGRVLLVWAGLVSQIEVGP